MTPRLHQSESHYNRTLLQSGLYITFRRIRPSVLQKDNNTSKFDSHHSTSLNYNSDRYFPYDLSTTPSSVSPTLSTSTNETEIGSGGGGGLMGSNATSGHQTQLNGWDLFRDFLRANATCFWNPTLVASVSSIEFKGYLAPSTILVSGSDYDLELIRNSWTKMILKCPEGYIIESLGDLGQVKASVVNQTHFTPLSEAICTTVYALGSQGLNTYPHNIMEGLAHDYPHLKIPPAEVIKRTLKSLQKEGKLRYISGRGYVVLPPDNYGSARLVDMVDSDPLKAPILISDEEALLRLHGNPNEETIDLHSQGVQVNMSSPLPKSRFQYSMDFGDLDTSGNEKGGPSIKRSASLRISRDKSGTLGSKPFSFMRSRSLKISRTKQRNERGEEPEAPNEHKKASMFSRLMNRFGGNSSPSQKTRAKSKTLSSFDLPQTQDNQNESTSLKQSRSTQTLSRSRPSQSTNSLSKTSKPPEMQSSKSKHKQALCYSTCGCCSTYVDPRNIMSWGSVPDYCVCESSYFCAPVLDPNCKHCIASMNAPIRCTDYQVNTGYITKSVNNPNVFNMRSEKRMQLKGTETQEGDTGKSLALRINELDQRTKSPSPLRGDQSDIELIDGKSSEAEPVSVNLNVDGTKNSLVPANAKHVNEKDLGELEDGKGKEKSYNKLGSSINVEIKLGSKSMADFLPQRTKSPETMASTFESNQVTGQKAPIAFVTELEDKPDTKGTSVTTTMTIPNPSFTDTNQKFMINTVTKTTTELNHRTQVNPGNSDFKVGSSFTNAVRITKQELDADRVPPANSDKSLSSFTNIREKVAKAKAAFFNVNDHRHEVYH